MKDAGEQVKIVPLGGGHWPSVHLLSVGAIEGQPSDPSVLRTAHRLYDIAGAE